MKHLQNKHFLILFIILSPFLHSLQISYKIQKSSDLIYSDHPFSFFLFIHSKISFSFVFQLILCYLKFFSSLQSLNQFALIFFETSLQLYKLFYHNQNDFLTILIKYFQLRKGLVKLNNQKQLLLKQNQLHFQHHFANFILYILLIQKHSKEFFLLNLSLLNFK